MDAGASIIALIGFALSSTKAIYETRSEVRDAPQIVKGAARNLRQALHHLKSIDNENGQDLPDEFRSVLREYQICLEAFNKKLEKLRVQPQDGGLRRSWRRFKTVLHEKDLERLHKTAREFTSMISDYRQAKQLWVASLTVQCFAKWCIEKLRQPLMLL